MPQAAESRYFMHQVMELGVKAGEGDELSLEGVKQEVYAFVRRVAGSVGGRPEAEAKGNFALPALVVEDILSQAAEWQTSLGEMLAQVQNQREQEVFLDLCPEGASAHGGRGQGVPCRASPVSSRSAGPRPLSLAGQPLRLGAGAWSMTGGSPRALEAR